jgi:hypothetical protein
MQGVKPRNGVERRLREREAMGNRKRRLYKPLNQINLPLA